MCFVYYYLRWLGMENGVKIHFSDVSFAGENGHVGASGYVGVGGVCYHPLPPHVSQTRF